MSNDEMVSVPRELLEDMHCHEDCPVEFIDHLRRALLAAPAVEVDPDDRHLSVLALLDVMRAVPSSSLYSLAEAVLDAGYTKAAQPQGEPVAFQWRCKTVNEGSQWRHWVDCTEEDYNKTIENSGPNPRGIIREVRKLYTRPAEQPAPAAVVLPARKPEPSCMTAIDDDREAAIYNSALDDVARLNSL